MDIEEIKRLLVQALLEMIKHDSHLLINDMSEQSLTHRLALYLVPNFPEHDVDCEYNGNVDSETGKKEIYILTQDAIRLGIIKEEEADDKSTISKRVFPDIIVHKRGRNTQNLLVIEAKKSTNTSQKAIWYDFEKLKRFTSRNLFDYTLGAYVELVTGQANPNYNVTWFSNGEELA